MKINEKAAAIIDSFTPEESKKFCLLLDMVMEEPDDNKILALISTFTEEQTGNIGLLIEALKEVSNDKTTG